ncbi:MAG: hypothetical protein HXX08_18125 [Chloroflexi bacterium]|uniref:YtkA-like domain-containing protein n=1 Tax=Candidatus Chlorohelix allophototropha TaxID=3003348 RepID=A0A8T7M6S5_9CHLR|nr:hypothetical protein [Chloroflexota bacterium]WJW69679.1 hypothetical protein OZ401_003307 [Chloroflexota bacterium L227-S17]
MAIRVRRLTFALALLGLTVFLLSFAGEKTAQAAPGYLIKDEIAGPYHLSIWASPNPISVGNIKLTIRLAQKGGVDQEYPVRNANFTVQFKQISGPGTENNPKKLLISNVLVATESDPGNYEVADSLAAEGKFLVSMNIDASPGKQKYEFEINALPQPEDRIFSIFLLFMVALFVFALVITYIRQGGKEAKQEAIATPATPTSVGSDEKKNEPINRK